MNLSVKKKQNLNVFRSMRTGHLNEMNVLMGVLLYGEARPRHHHCLRVSGNDEIILLSYATD